MSTTTQSDADGDNDAQQGVIHGGILPTLTPLSDSSWTNILLVGYLDTSKTQSVCVTTLYEFMYRTNSLIKPQRSSVLFQEELIRKASTSLRYFLVSLALCTNILARVVLQDYRCMVRRLLGEVDRSPTWKYFQPRNLFHTF